MAFPGLENVPVKYKVGPVLELLSELSKVQSLYAERPFMASTFKNGLTGVAIVVGLMIIFGTAVQLFYPSDWHPVEATVQGAHIERTRPGTLQWSFMVDATYEVANQVYETTQDVFHDSDRPVAEAQRADWPVGRKFTLYVDADHPKNTSRVPDGGRDATTVVAVILTPLLLIVLGFVLILVRQLRANGEETAGP
jgi:hypothetical protein